MISFPRRELAAWWRSPAALVRTVSWFRGLAAGYDLAIDAQGLLRTALMARASGAPIRIGRADARECSGLLMTERVPCAGMHDVERTLALARAACGEAVEEMSLWVDMESLRRWEARRPGPGSYAVLAPTSRWKAKCWHPEGWDGLCRWLLRSGGIRRVVLVGAPGEEAQVARLACRGEEGCIDLCGALGVGETMAAIAGAALVVANDSAPLHMAVGLSRPFVALFGPTDERRVGPWRGEEWVVRAAPPPSDAHAYRSSDDALMRAIPAEAVCERAAAAMERGAGASTP